jgi:arylformamidase
MTHRIPLRHLFWVFALILNACAPLSVSASGSLVTATPQIPDSNPLPTTATPFQTIAPTRDNADGQAFEIQKALDIAYAHTSGIAAHLQSLDVYYTEPVTAHRPVVIYVHGGGWTSGDKAHLDFKTDFFLKAGYVLISVNYRLSPEAVFPAHVQDVAAAIAWANQKIGQYGGDPNQLYVSGHSAGGHLATLVATDERYLKEQGLSLAAIKGVISIDTAGYDFSIYASRCKNRILPVPYSITFGQNPAEWNSASPVTYIEAGKHIPPMALIYSGDVGFGSEVLREQMAKEFGDKLTGAHVYNEVFGAREKNHGEINTDFGKPGDPVGLKTLEFLKKIQSTP